VTWHWPAGILEVWTIVCRGVRLHLCSLLLALTPLALAQNAASAQGEGVVPWTLALEQRLQPWCPAACVSEVAFTASYRGNDDVLVFVGAHHVFTPQNSTLRAVFAGFAQASPAIVIVEGFPTSMGANPPPLVDEANRYGTPQADEFAKGEAMYAASLALRHGVPFVGGEPTREEQLQALVRRGYTATDVYFAYLVGGLSQSIRSGAITGPADPRLTDAFASSALWFARQLSLQPMTLADFSARYRAMFGVDVTRDAELTQRSEPGTSSPVALLNQADMFTRDQHLLATIEAQLALKKRVLVVYGGSHWTTLSGALQKRLGKPTIRSSFPEGP